MLAGISQFTLLTSLFVRAIKGLHGNVSGSGAGGFHPLKGLHPLARLDLSSSSAFSAKRRPHLESALHRNLLGWSVPR